MGDTGDELAPGRAERLTKVEEYQAFRSKRVTSKDNVMALSWRIATEPKLYRELIPNPYAPTSLQTMSERLPEANTADVIRALVLAEPEGTYDRNFRQLPREQQRDELYRQIDISAEITMRLAKYFNEHTQEFWDLPQDQIYERLTSAAFGISDLREVEEKYAQSQRRGFRMSVVNFIDDLQKLKPYKNEFATDPKVTAGRIFDKEIEGKIEVESLPVGFVVYLDEVDYGKFESISDEEKNYFSSGGLTLFHSSLPPELRGRVIVINKGGEKRGVETPEQIRGTREHEVRHILFSSFLAEGELYRWDTEKNLNQLHYFEDHQAYAEQLRRNFLYHTKDEVIAYYASGDVAYKALGDLAGDQWLEHLEKVRDHLWIQDDLVPEEKALIYDQYQAKFVSYLEQIREYQWIAQKLFQTAREHEREASSIAFRERPKAIKETGGDIGSEESKRRASEQLKDVLTVEKVEALLQNTAVDKARRLGRYFGVAPEDIPKRQREEQQQLVEKFTTVVNELTAPRKGMPPLGEVWLPWSDRLSFDERRQIILQYPQKVMPALIKAIEGANNEFVVEDCVSATKIILYMNHYRMSPQELTTVRTTLETMLTKRTSDEFKGARSKAQYLLRTIDEVYMYGGVDFIHHKPIGVDVAQVMGTVEGQEPSVEQVIQLVDLLPGKEPEVWWKYFNIDYLDILTKQPEGVLALVKIGNTVTNPYFVGATIQTLDENFATLKPEARTEINSMLSHVVSVSYTAPPDILETLRLGAEKLRKRLG